MAIQEGRTQRSIILTLRVLQFVNQLRRCLKLRLQGPKNSSALGTETCLGLESKVFRNFAKGLSRVSLQDRKQSIHASDRVCKSRNRNRTRPMLKLQATGQDSPTIQNISAGEVQHMLSAIDGKLSSPGSALSAVANDDRLFLKQNSATSFEAYSLSETIQSVVMVNDALNVLRACRSQHCDEWIIRRGQEEGWNFDETFLANYEHLLLRLQTMLIDALGRKVVEALLLGNHNKKQRRLLAWFTEFSDKPRPLSTFPWTIKPSLAVLWGVCWMFYDRQNVPQSSQRGNIRRSQPEMLQDLVWWPTPEPTNNFGFVDLPGTQPQPGAQQLSGNDGSGGFNGGRNAGIRMPNMHLELPSQPRSRVSRNQGTGLSTYFPSLPANVQEARSAPSLSTLNSANTNLAVYPQFNPGDSWAIPQSSPLPRRSARPPTEIIPTLTVTKSAAPQVPPASYQDFSTSFGFTMGNHQLPEASSIHNFQGPRNDHAQSNISSSNMPTPVSIADPRSPLLSPTGDRRHSIASSHRSSLEGDDINSPERRNHAYKRSEEPPRNDEGKMMCKHKECAGLTFDRKCEWSKHMDKHDRPYKCTVKGCEKLQGFTYSGGLLRHEREVHKMHGGTKKSLFCPFSDCKRSSGSGFTRKENLAEHVRRVHRRTSISADLGHLIVKRSNTEDETTSTEARLSSESPYQRLGSAGTDDEAQLAPKRKRFSEISISEEGEESDLRSEVKRLRQENEAKDARLRQLEAAVMALQQQR